MPPVTNRVGGFRFSLKRLLAIFAILAVIVFIPTWLYRSYYWQLYHVQAVVAAHPEIENVVILGNDDAIYEAEWLEFSIAGKPNSRVALVIPHQERIDGGEKLWLAQLGPWNFFTRGHGYDGVYDAKTMEPKKTDFHHTGIDVGSDGPFADALPMKVRSVGDIVANYDQLVEFFETWPNDDNPGVIHDQEGAALRYSATR